MSNVFYIMGSNDLVNWVHFDGPFKSYPDMATWRAEEYLFRHYKVVSVWEFPF